MSENTGELIKIPSSKEGAFTVGKAWDDAEKILGEDFTAALRGFWRATEGWPTVERLAALPAGLAIGIETSAKGVNVEELNLPPELRQFLKASGEFLFPNAAPTETAAGGVLGLFSGFLYEMTLGKKEGCSGALQGMGEMTVFMLAGASLGNRFGQELTKGLRAAISTLLAQ